MGCLTASEATRRHSEPHTSPCVGDVTPRYRPVALGSAPAHVRQRGDIWYFSSTEALHSYPERLADCLISGAQAHPERWLAARRGHDGNWIGISYADMLARSRAIGQALLDRNLSTVRPVMILSGNDLEHLQMSLGALLAGVPFAPISPAYALGVCAADEFELTAGTLRRAASRPLSVWRTDLPKNGLVDDELREMQLVAGFAPGRP